MAHRYLIVCYNYITLNNERQWTIYQFLFKYQITSEGVRSTVLTQDEVFSFPPLLSPSCSHTCPNQCNCSHLCPVLLLISLTWCRGHVRLTLSLLGQCSWLVWVSVCSWWFLLLDWPWFPLNWMTLNYWLLINLMLLLQCYIWVLSAPWPPLLLTNVE